MVGSTTKLGIETNDIDIRGFYANPDLFNPFRATQKTEWRKTFNEYGKTLDFDYWEITYAIRQMVKGHNSCNLLFCSLFSPTYETSPLGAELVANRKKLLSENLITGTLSFCDRKARASRSSTAVHHPSKYLYYACSDLLDMGMILENNAEFALYPLELPDEVLAMKHDKHYDMSVYNKLKRDFIDYAEAYDFTELDRNWIIDYSKRVYKESL